LLGSRQDKEPGIFKTKANRAGITSFVSPELVNGTLKQGFGFYNKLSSPLAKAIFMMFLVAEVHPFSDGNGRVGRIMMNAELVSADEQRILVPTVYRNNYLQALRALSHNGLPNPLVRVLDFAQKYTKAVSWDNYDQALETLTKTYAFLDPNVADEEGIHLFLPSRVIDIAPINHQLQNS
jgi:Fic family protein